MRILIRGNDGEEWQTVDSVSYANESELQALLARSPSLVPIGDAGEETGELCVAVREFGLPGSGSTNIVAFTSEGDIAVVECKLAANPEAKRKVVGQIRSVSTERQGAPSATVGGALDTRKSAEKLSDSLLKTATELTTGFDLDPIRRFELRRIDQQQPNGLAGNASRQQTAEPRDVRSTVRAAVDKSGDLIEGMAATSACLRC